MTEEVLKVGLAELATVRLLRPDGTVLEMPAAKLTEYAVRQSHEFPASTARNLKELGQLLAELTTRETGVGIEFVVAKSSR